MRNTISKNLFLSFLCLFLGGCALTKETVDLSYQPLGEPLRVAGAEKVGVRVSVDDGRTIRDAVSKKKNGYGMEMAHIVSKQDVSELFRAALETELARRGFQEGDNVTVIANLAKFYNDFKTGFWSGDAVAELTMTIQVKGSDGAIAYLKAINVEGKKEGIQLATGQNAKASLEQALQRGIGELFRDDQFTASILKVGGGTSAPIATR